jgi:hypothetical protein
MKNSTTIRNELLRAYEMWPQFSDDGRDLLARRIQVLRNELAQRRCDGAAPR